MIVIILRGYFLFLSLFLLIISCTPLPREKLSQVKKKMYSYEVVNDSLHITIINPLHCPVRFDVLSSDKTIQTNLRKNFPITLAALSDSIMGYPSLQSKEEMALKFSIAIGDVKAPVYKKAITLPFPKGRRYKIMQAYNGSFSHSSENSKCAIDFNLQEGDTVCAAADGYVVGVIEGYKEGGMTRKWRDYANFITVFHPDMNLYTQYAHLMYEGSIVGVGDYVEAGQAIGLSGNTGFTSSAHLHFNIWKPTPSSMESLEINFVEGYKGRELQKGDWIEK